MFQKKQAETVEQQALAIDAAKPELEPTADIIYIIFDAVLTWANASRLLCTDPARDNKAQAVKDMVLWAFWGADKMTQKNLASRYTNVLQFYGVDAYFIVHGKRRKTEEELAEERAEEAALAAERAAEAEAARRQKRLDMQRKQLEAQEAENQRIREEQADIQAERAERARQRVEAARSVA